MRNGSVRFHGSRGTIIGIGTIAGVGGMSGTDPVS